jgi:CRISPR-associated protein Cas1
MKKLLNTLYVLTPDSYLFVRNQSIAIRVGGEEKFTIPAHTIDAVVCFGVCTVSTPFIGFCAEHGITLTFLSPNGQFYGRVCGPVSGNILLRKKQYCSLDDVKFASHTVRNILYGKLRNSKDVLLRSARNQTEKTASLCLKEAAESLTEFASKLETDDIDSMRGIEGAAATVYFAQFDTMLRSSDFKFQVRSRRPPRNEVNATLSFVYMLLTREMQSALETVGLDPAAGYLHTLRPGRPSFALDMIEELRAPLCDRFVLSLFNKGQVKENDFDTDSEAVYLNERGRRTVLAAWQQRKKEVIQHPFLNEKIRLVNMLMQY